MTATTTTPTSQLLPAPPKKGGKDRRSFSSRILGIWAVLVYIWLFAPIFVIVLLTQISGIPLLESKADGYWGDQAAYQAYKARTSVLVPLPPRAAGSEQL